MFKKYEYNIHLVAEPFENLKYRDRTALILCRDGKGNYILGASDQYPEGIVRMVGGGIDTSETVAEGAMRELSEEIGVTVEPKEMIELAEVYVTGDYNGKQYKHRVFVYFFNSKKDDYLAGDDVDDVVSLSEKEYRELVQTFLHLKDDYLYDNQKGTIYSWGDYGKVYGFVHQVALDEVLDRGL